MLKGCRCLGLAGAGVLERFRSRDSADAHEPTTCGPLVRLHPTLVAHFFYSLVAQAAIYRVEFSTRKSPLHDPLFVVFAT